MATIMVMMKVATTGTMAMMANIAIRPLRLALYAAVIAAIVLAAGIHLSGWGRFVPSPATLVKIGGPFELTTHGGEKLSDTDLKGTPFALYFGFTHCPEVCPTTLWEMSETLARLGDDADKLKVLFVSVDPERDNREALALYLQSFDQRIIGLTGSEEEIQALGRHYRAYWKKIPLEGEDYTMDHTASIYLMDAAGEFTGTISYDEQADALFDKLKKLIAGETL